MYKVNEHGKHGGLRFIREGFTEELRFKTHLGNDDDGDFKALGIA